jgi:hypothetical protein
VLLCCKSCHNNCCVRRSPVVGRTQREPSRQQAHLGGLVLAWGWVGTTLEGRVPPTAVTPSCMPVPPQHRWRGPADSLSWDQSCTCSTHSTEHMHQPDQQTRCEVIAGVVTAAPAMATAAVLHMQLLLRLQATTLPASAVPDPAACAQVPQPHNHSYDGLNRPATCMRACPLTLC